MILFEVLDIDFDSILNQHYSIALFSSGYESRCIYLPKQINPKKVSRPVALGFKEESQNAHRLQNDNFYIKHWKSNPCLLSGEDDKLIYEYLQNNTNTTADPLYILLDYSSMSRLWYSAVLNWARIAVASKVVIIDFIYAMGEYEEEKRPMVIRNMFSIPGCESRAYRQRETVAVFGLGFHGYAAYYVMDRLEADIVYVFLASPGSTEHYVNKTKQINKDLIEHPNTKRVIELPLASLESCYRILAETIAPYRQDSEITLVPMGPKPHVLASILLAMRFPEVGCLRVSGDLYPVDVKPTGEIVASRIIIRK